MDAFIDIACDIRGHDAYRESFRGHDADQKCRCSEDTTHDDMAVFACESGGHSIQCVCSCLKYT